MYLSTITKYLYFVTSQVFFLMRLTPISQANPNPCESTVHANGFEIFPSFHENPLNCQLVNENMKMMMDVCTSQKKKHMYRCVSVWSNKNLKKLLTNCLIRYLPTGLLYPDAKTLFSPSFFIAPVTPAFPPARRVVLLRSLHFIFEAVLGENWREKKARKNSATLFIYLFIYSSSSSSSSGGSVHLYSGGPPPARTLPLLICQLCQHRRGGGRGWGAVWD